MCFQNQKFWRIQHRYASVSFNVISPEAMQMPSDPQVKPPGTHRLQHRATHFILWKCISTSFERTIRDLGQIFTQYQICGSLHDAPKLKTAILHEYRQACAENCSFLHQQLLSVRNSYVRKSGDLKKHPGQRT